ncbi:unnamed protein product, partial [marine sediment metagenome]
SNLDRDVLDWRTLQAATVLAQLGKVGQDNQIHKTLLKLIADKNMTLEDRCQIAKLLGKIDYQGAKINGEVTGWQLVQLAVDVFVEEAKRAKMFEDRKISGSRPIRRDNSRRRPTRRGSGTAVEYERRRAITLLSDLQVGLRAIGPSVPKERAALFKTVTSAIQSAITTTTNPNSIDLDVVDEVRRQAREILDAASQWKAPEGTAAAASDERAKGSVLKTARS